MVSVNTNFNKLHLKIKYLESSLYKVTSIWTLRLTLFPGACVWDLSVMGSLETSPSTRSNEDGEQLRVIQESLAEAR